MIYSPGVIRVISPKPVSVKVGVKVQSAGSTTPGSGWLVRKLTVPA
jgi:hypothetical protein